MVRRIQEIAGSLVKLFRNATTTIRIAIPRNTVPACVPRNWVRMTKNRSVTRPISSASYHCRRWKRNRRFCIQSVIAGCQRIAPDSNLCSRSW